MRVLADTLARNYNKTDFILLSDLNEKAFKGVDNELVNKFETDSRKRIENIDYGEELLKVILLFSLEKNSPAATESDVFLGSFKPTAGMTLDQLSMSLENLYGNAHYLHKDDGHYSIKKERNVTALIKSEVPDVDEDDGVKPKLKDLIKKRIFDNQAYIYELETDEIPDDSQNLKFVVTLKPYGDEDQVKGELESFLREKQYENNYVFIVPKKSLLDDSDLIGKIKNICAAENLKTRVDEKIGEIEHRIKEDIEESISYIEDLYGYWIKWVPKDDSYEVSVVKKRVDPDIHEIRKAIKTDETLLKEKLLNEVKGKEGGRKIGTLLDDFKKMRKYPLVSDDNNFYNLLKKLNKEEIIIRGDRGKEYWDSDPKEEIKDSWEVIDIDFVSPPEMEEEEEIEIGQTKLGEEEPPEDLEEKKKTRRVTKSERGNSAQSIATKYEMGINEDALEGIRTVKLDIEFEELTKQELLDFISNLPDCEFVKSEIEVEEIEDQE
ncbi:hypothetical protein AKJ49_01570 [candidate division MSBL1 archaeon SCGC-AAA382A03]|uniref:Uncharacterized protein n=1 Tax=candidate division MSBL1 archaeon SCGC-AAA382A03 TaxID=1698278 RepID=A0A133VET0_9EURY|nr:hypothetical protein AKJ49_01570 [candidate division MSBL1 archaeon SCGC-AAA382A03]